MISTPLIDERLIPLYDLVFPGSRARPPAAKPVESAVPTASETAAAIVRSGKIRRGELSCDALPEQVQGHRATAAEIIAAGKKARGEKP